MKVQQNDVSLFIAGYKACMVANCGETPEEIEHLSYTTIEFENRIKTYLRAYTSKETDGEGLQEMYAAVLKEIPTL